jgi:hypothetical protein
MNAHEMTFTQMFRLIREIDHSSIPAQQVLAEQIKARLDAEHPGWRSW